MTSQKLSVYSNDPKISRANDEKWRFSVANYIQEGKFKLKICEINSMFLSSTTKILNSDEKGSASNSIILFGSLKIPLKNSNKEVVGKIFFTPINKERDNSLEVEYHVYNEIISNFLKYHITPHLIMFIGYATCEIHTCPNIPPLLEKIIKESHQTIEKKQQNRYNFDEMHILLLEKSKGRKLHDHIQSNDLSWKDWKAILFQLIYTIQCFLEIGFMHNDMHAGNIFVDEIPETSFVYFVNFGKKNMQCFNVKTKYMLRIYDFDFATYKSLSVFSKNNYTPQQNTKVSSNSSLCKKGGICKQVNWYTDLFRIFTGISRAKQPVELKDWLYTYVRESFIMNDTLAKKGVLCKSQSTNFCKKIKPTVDQLSTPLYILNDGFRNFKITSPITEHYIENHQPHVYATPKSRKIFPPKSKEDSIIHLGSLKNM